MEKIAYTLITCIITISPFISFSQEYIAKGHYLVGGSFNISNYDSEEVTEYRRDIIENNHFSFSPYGGKFLKDNLLLGTSLTFSKSINDRFYYDENNYDRLFTNKSNLYGLNIFLRRYFEIKGNFGWHIQPYIGYSYTKRRDSQHYIYHNNSQETTEKLSFITHRANLGTTVGLYYFITDRFSLETNLATIRITYEYDDNHMVENDNNPITRSEQVSDRMTFALNFVNTLSISQILTINYYF